MAMEINNHLTPAQVDLKGTGSARTDNEAAERGGAPAAGARDQDDRVTLTPAAQRLNEAENRIAETPQVDRKRVEAIKAAIASGQYQVDSQRIANRLIRLERALDHK